MTYIHLKSRPTVESSENQLIERLDSWLVKGKKGNWLRGLLAIHNVDSTCHSMEPIYDQIFEANLKYQGWKWMCKQLL